MSDERVTHCFIGSFLDEPDEALIVLSGDIDAAAVARLEAGPAPRPAARRRDARVGAGG